MRAESRSDALRLHARELGTGPSVVLLHCSAGSGAQWRALARPLAGQFRVLAPDLAGYGASPARPAGAFDTLTAHALAVARVIDAVPGPVHLVGHSFGGAVAIRLALLLGPRVRSLALIEPVAFWLLRAGGAQDASALEEIRGVGAAMAADLRRAGGARAMRRFVEYWNGRGAWNALDTSRRADLAARAQQVVEDFDAIEAEPARIGALAAIAAPTLVLHAGRTPRPAAVTARRVASAIPGAQRVCIRDAGHMAPITHPEFVNLLLGAHLDLAEQRAARQRLRGVHPARRVTPAVDASPAGPSPAWRATASNPSSTTATNRQELCS